MSEDVKWLIGILAGVGGIAVGAFWRVIAMIRKVDDDATERTDALHSRVNRVREDMASKADLDNHLQSLQSEMRAIRRAQSEQAGAMNSRMDALMQAVVQRNTDRG